MRTLNLILSFLISSPALASDWQIVQRDQVSLRKPSFISIENQPGSDAPRDLLVSFVWLLGPDFVYRLALTGEPTQAGGVTTSILTQKIPWPNEVTSLDAKILGRAGHLVCSGFLVPTKSTGAISFVDGETGVVTSLTQPKSNFFYHRAAFVDLTQTGRLDIITTRARIPLVGPPRGELVWLQRPADPLSGPWPEVVLAQGPDIHFRVFKSHEASGDEWMVIAAEFSNRRLTLTWIDPRGKVGSRVIDDTLGAPFDLDFYDLNNDGHQDLLVTNHQADPSASVFAYEIPADLKKGSWTRHTLATGIITLQKGIRQASPGVAKAFFPELAQRGRQKPWVLVSGDGSQKLHLLKPLSEDRDDWRYDRTEILDTKSTVGEPVIADFDHDGLADIAVPAYDTNKIYFLSFKSR